MNEEQMNQDDESKEPKSEIKKPEAKSKEKTWQDRVIDMDFMSPIYILVAIILFKNGADGYDLHDAIIKFIATYNGH